MNHPRYTFYWSQPYGNPEVAQQLQLLNDQLTNLEELITEYQLGHSDLGQARDVISAIKTKK
jgi:hypothetical protein